MVQTKVNRRQAVGVRGEYYDNSPRRALPFNLEANGNNLPKVGCVFTEGTDKNTAKIGGTGIFKGILAHPKAYANFKNLSPNLELEEGSIGELTTMCRLLVEVEDDITVGMVGIYNTTTGEIKGMAADGTPPSGYAKIPNSEFDIEDANAEELAVLKLTN